MYRRHEGFLQGHDHTQLFFQVWENPEATGTIIIHPGQGEHSECYNRVVEAVKDHRWSVWCLDARGHGRSDGKRGYAANFEDYVRDYKIFLRKVLADSRVTGKPVVLLSHSMGGLIQLKTLIDEPDVKVTAQVCSAPLLGLALPVPPWKSNAAQLMNRIYPKITMWNEIRNEQLTRDLDIIREFEHDVLRHDSISPGVFLGFQPAWEYVRQNAAQIKTPALFQLPEKDPVVSTEASLDVFAQLGTSAKELKVYGDGARHEMYNDIHRQTVFKDLNDYLDQVRKS